MPRPATEIESCSFARWLILGDAKVGKTCTVLKSCIGRAYVICSDDKYSLHPATEFTTNFDYDYAFGDNPRDIEKCIHEAAKGVKEGRYQTIVWDTITKYCYRATQFFEEATENANGGADGRRFWRDVRKHVMNALGRLDMLPAHLIVNSHFAEQGKAVIEGQMRKQGQGIAPGIEGKLRFDIPAWAQDVIFLSKLPNGQREFVLSEAGVYGPGSRNLPGVETMPADVGLLWEAMTKHNQQKRDAK